MKLYTVGFVFDKNIQQVLLVHKQKPDWQIGKLNGMGGKVEGDETLPECMARECFEETTLNIPANDWVYFATIIDEVDPDDKKQITFFATTYTGLLVNAKKGDYEDVEWFPVKQLPENVVTNLHFLIPLAQQKLLGYDFQEVILKY